jgi:hypothetical protein
MVCSDGKAIEEAVYDLRAVNPNRVVEEDM